MSNIIATYLTDGKNRACFMNALTSKFNNNDGSTTISLYSTDNPEFTSSVTIDKPEMDIPETVEQPVLTIYNMANIISDDDKSSDCTSTIQEYIDKCSNAGGGILYFGSGIYRLNGIKLNSKVSLVGNGEGNTILVRNMVSTGNTEMDTYNNGTAFIEIPITSAGCSIKDMTIYGGAINAATDDTILQVSGITSYIDPFVVDGIYILDSPNTITSDNGNIVSSYNIHTTDSKFKDNTLYKYITLKNISVIGFSGSGIIVGTNNTNVYIDSIKSNMNRYNGLVIGGNDCIISNSEITGNGTHGIYNLGSNNLYNNILCQYNGKYAHTSSKGFYSVGDYCTSSNISLKSNWCTGLEVTANYNQMNNILLDANGGRSSHDPNGGTPNPKDVPQVILYGKFNTLRGTCTNHLETSTIFVSSRSLECGNGLTNSIIELLVTDKSGEDLPVINNVEIDSSIYSQQINSNLVTVIIDR